MLQGREAVFLRDRADILKMRLLAVKSKQCANQKNKYFCPEVFLDVVADKLTSTAVLFLDVELLSEFYHNVSFNSYCFPWHISAYKCESVYQSVLTHASPVSTRA